MYLVLSATDQEKAVRELTQQVHETTHWHSHSFLAFDMAQKKYRVFGTYHVSAFGIRNSGNKLPVCTTCVLILSGFMLLTAVLDGL